MNNIRIFLDMDGVIVDFVNAALRVHGEYNLCEDDIYEYDLCSFMGLSHTQFFAKFDDRFWEHEVELYSHALRLIESLPIKNTCLLTSPTIGGATGKQLFIKKHLPFFFKNKKYLIGPAKEMCAGPNCILIDDFEDNCNKFKEHGGHALLFPRPWNESEDTVEAFIQRLDIKYNELIRREVV